MPSWIEVLLFIKKRNRAAIKAKEFAAIAAFLFLQNFLNMAVFEVFRCLLLRGTSCQNGAKFENGCPF